MSIIAERLQRGVAILEELEQESRETNAPRWGYDTEYAIIAAELRDLEEDILSDPGTLEIQLVRVRRK
jgi:hypothetical protein